MKEEDKASVDNDGLIEISGSGCAWFAIIIIVVVIGLTLSSIFGC